jgi:hypothetical protein
MPEGPLFAGSPIISAESRAKQRCSQFVVGWRHPGLASYTWLMPRGCVARSLGRAVGRVPGLRRVPVLKLFVAAEIALLARDHIMRLDRRERHRLVELVWMGRGRRRDLSDAEREELAVLMARMEPRLLAGHAVDKLSPLPLPRRLVYGPRKRR